MSRYLRYQQDMLKALTVFVTFAGAVALAAGYLGALHPAGDSLSVFRTYVAALVGLGGLGLWVQRQRRLAALALVLAAVAVLPMTRVSGRAQAGGDAGLSLYQKNMLFRMADPAGLAADMLARRPDFITLQEVSGANLALFDTLGAEYPARRFCPFATVGGVAVASRWPMRPGSGTCADHDGLAAMQVDSPAGPVWVISIHLHWPWPHGQAAQAARLAPLLARFDGPKVIGGDFNMAPWSYRLRDLSRRTGTAIIGRPHVTLVKFGGWLRVPIDHVLVTGQGSTERLPQLGSDHYGLLARFTLDGNG